MSFRKVSTKEWRAMGLPSSIMTISFGVGVPKKKVLKKPTFVLNSNTSKKKK
jgi:hypothetical protein